MEKETLSYPKLSKFIGDNGFEKSLALKNLREIRAEFSPVFVKKLGDFLDMPFSKLYDGVNLDIPEDLDLKKLYHDKNIIFVPNHQSHADYMALNWALHDRYDTSIPIHIAGGVNLNIFPIGTMFRKSGCFFLKRKFSDDLNYKNVFEGYLYYLLKQGWPIEFFFEGGRSRTGKLMPPRFGLFSMLLDAHKVLAEQGEGKELVFVPISIMHEFVPEEKSLIKELGGGSKTKESSTQLLKLFRLLKKELGTIHIKVGHPLSKNKIIGEEIDRKSTQKLAFKCYRSVGKGMSVTPISLLSLILLDEPAGALTYEQIIEKVHNVLDYCHKMNVPVTSSLNKENLEDSVKRGLELLVNDRKIKILKKKKLLQTFYVIDQERRLELLYFKNTILHHFLVPYFMNSMLVNILNGNISTLDDLKKFLRVKRDQLKYEFYLPEIKEVIQKSLEIVNHALDREVKTIEDCLHLTGKEFYKVAAFIGGFVRSYNYIFECYYIAALTLKHFQDMKFDEDQFFKTAQEVHELEREHGQFINLLESYSIPPLKNALQYFENLGLLRNDEKEYILIDMKCTDELLQNFRKDLTDLLTFNLDIKY